MLFLAPWLTASNQITFLTGADARLLLTGARSGHPDWPLSTSFPSSPSSAHGVWAAPGMAEAICIPVLSTQAAAPSTLYQVVSGLPLHLRAELSGFLEILQDKDIRCKMNHILLSAAKGKTEEVAEMVQSWPHDVSW